jgi:aminodeoxyfutalosine synthase
MSGTNDVRLREIRSKIENAERLSFDDGLCLDRYADLAMLGELANIVLITTSTNISTPQTFACIVVRSARFAPT